MRGRPSALAGCAAAGLLAQAPSALAGKGPLIASPAPNSVGASPATQLSFLGAPWRGIRAVTAVGSRSGDHPGRVRRYSGGQGESFLPTRPFLAGETVKVRVSRRGGAALRYSFAVGTPASLSPLLTPLPPGPAQSQQTQAFVTRPDLHPPRLDVTLRTPRASRGDIFLAPIAGPGPVGARPQPPIGPAGPMIVDGAGNLVWFQPVQDGEVAMNLHPLRYRGRSALGWWQGRVFPQGFGFGSEVIADRSYRTIAVVRAGNGYQAGLHEFAPGPAGGALLTIYAPVTLDLSAAGGSPHATVLDSIVQEVDIRTGLVMYEWHSLGHVGLDETYVRPAPSAAAPFDPWHVNSIQALPDGRLLISERNTWAVYAIDMASGRIGWRLGGKRSSFALGPGAAFAWQHDARLSGDTLSLFDDEAAPPVGRQSRGLVLRLDLTRHTAAAVRQFAHPAGILTGSQGNLQRLTGGGAFVGWGAAPQVSEFAADGQLVFDARFPAPDETYRAFRRPWAGRPLDRPALAVQRGGDGRLRAWASWNGATAVARWLVLGGPDPTHLHALGSVAKQGFETAIEEGLPAVSYAAVRALSASGRVLGTSAAVRPA